MTKTVLLAGLLAAVWALAPAMAQAAPNQVDNYLGPAGSAVPAQGVQTIGYDSLTGAPCVAGKTATCAASAAIGSPTTDGSGTITTGGAPQALFGGATPANGFKVAIPSGSPAAFICWLSDSVTAPSATTAGSYPVQAVGQYASEPGQKPMGPVYLNCPTTGQVFSAERW
jgi:hypothetical protein